MNTTNELYIEKMSEIWVLINYSPYEYPKYSDLS